MFVVFVFLLFVLLMLVEFLLVGTLSPLVILAFIASQSITALFGYTVLRKYDINQLAFLEAEIRKNNRIVRELWEEGVLMVAALLLIMPGLITDVCAALLFVAGIRRFLLDFFVSDPL